MERSSEFARLKLFRLGKGGEPVKANFLALNLDTEKMVPLVKALRARQ
jgi:hypothetical protein